MEENVKTKESKLILLSGPSGSGKTSISNLLTSKYGIYPLMYYTTRNKRNDDNTKLFKYITTEEFIEMQNNGKFILSFGSHNRYGVSFEEFINNIKLGHDMILTISYNDFFDILERKINDMVDVHLIILTFHDIPTMINERLTQRNQNISLSNLDMKTRYAIYEHEKYFNDIRPYADSVIYTDDETIDDTETKVYNAVYNNKYPVLKRRK